MQNATKPAFMEGGCVNLGCLPIPSFALQMLSACGRFAPSFCLFLPLFIIIVTPHTDHFPGVSPNVLSRCSRGVKWNAKCSECKMQVCEMIAILNFFERKLDKMF